MTPKRASDVRLMHRPRLGNIVAREARISRNPEVAKLPCQPSPAHLPLDHQPAMVALFVSAPPPRRRRRWEETASGSGRRRLGVGSNALQIAAVRLVEPHGVAGADYSCLRISPLQRRRTEVVHCKSLDWEAGTSLNRER